jgi:hypothetical protein
MYFLKKLVKQQMQRPRMLQQKGDSVLHVLCPLILLDHKKTRAPLLYNSLPFPQKEKKLCIKYIGKFFLIEKIIFNIV